MAFHVQPLASQPNLLARRKEIEGEEAPLVKLTTFGSQGSSKEAVEGPVLLTVSKPASDWDKGRSMSFGHPEGQKQETKPEEVKRRDEPSFHPAIVTDHFQSQPTAAFEAETHIRERIRAMEESHESESIFTLVTDQSEAELVEKVGEERAVVQTEDSVLMRKNAILRLATAEREEFELVHRCCRRLQKGAFAVVSVYRDEDWWLLSVSELLSRHRCEVVLEPGHLWTQKHSAVELASLIEKDSDDKLILPAQRLDLFVPKESDQNLSVQTNGSDRRKSASFGPKRDTTRKKMFSGIEYDLGIEVKMHGPKAGVNVSAIAPGQTVAMTECFSQADLREASLSMDMSDIERVADALLPRLQVAQGALRLRPSMGRRESINSLIPEISGISYQTARVLNNDRKYLITFSSIPLGTGTEKTIYVDAQPQDYSDPLEKQLEVDEDELRQLIQFPDGELLPEHLEEVADFLIIENGNELHMGKRQIVGKRFSDAPAIVVVMDRSERDEYTRVPVKRQKTYTVSSLEDAAVQIQSYWRMKLARESIAILRSMKCRKLLKREWVRPQNSVLSIYQSGMKTYVAMESLRSDFSSKKAISAKRIPSVSEALALFTNSTEKEASIALLLQRVCRRKLARDVLARTSKQSIPMLTKLQSHNSIEYVVSAFKRDSGLMIEMTPLQPEAKGQIAITVFTERELKKFGAKPSLEAVLQAVRIQSGKVTLASSITVVHKSTLKLEDLEVQVTVSVDDLGDWRNSVLTFQAVNESLQLEKKCSVSKVMENLGDIASVNTLAELATHTLLTISDGQLALDTSKNVEEMAVRLQAASRGFLERKRLKRKKARKGKLVAVTSKVMVGQKYAIYAYLHEQGLTVQALQKGKDPLTLEVPPGEVQAFGPKQYCEQVLFPKISVNSEGKLELVESERAKRRPYLSVQSIATTSIVSQPPSPTGGADTSSPLHSKTLKRFDSDNISDTDDPSFRMKIPTPKIKPEKRLRKPVKKRNKSETTSGVTQRKSKYSDVLFIPVYESQPSELITKVGADISGSYFIIAIYRASKGLRIEATQSASSLVLRLSVQEPVPEDPLEAESLCSSIIDRLRLRKNKDGLVLELRPSAPQVLYKRSHYVSERYMVVTVLDFGQSVELQAADPASQKMLKLTLGRMKFLTPELLYRELCSVVKRLRVEKVLGEDVLILSQ